MKLVLCLVFVSLVGCVNHPCKPTGNVKHEVQEVGDDDVLPREYQLKEYTCTEEAHWI